jgi:hypothetical protein
LQCRDPFVERRMSHEETHEAPRAARSTTLPMIRARNMTNVFNTPCNKARVTISPFATWLISGQGCHDERENALHEPLLGKNDRNIVTRQSNRRDDPIQFQGWRLGGGPAGGGGNDHCADTLGYMLVISSNNVVEGWHAI